MVICSKCGLENDNEARFCFNCGVPLDQVSESIRTHSTRNIEKTYPRIYNDAIPGLIIGAIIIFIGITYSIGQDFGRIIGNWAGNFGQFMGNWGENFGRNMGEWGENFGRFFADFGISMGSKFGASIAIIIGLIIIAYTLNVYNRY